jgi:asparagine synthetase B (glutamine-hydrolysing)
VSLRPFANLFAFGHEDPRALAAMKRRLSAAREFTQVWSPHPAWLCASAPLPHGEADDDQVRQHGLAFAEGREQLDRALDRDREHSLARLHELACDAPQRLVELPGDFGFFVFGRDGALNVVRACAGLVPFYCARRAGGVAVSTRLEYMVRFVDPDATLDPLPNASWLAGTALFPDGRTFLRGVTALEPGACTRLGPRHALAVEHYWFPQHNRPLRPTPARQEDHARRLRALLLERLCADLAPDASNLLSLSGGVDSSALAALVAGDLHRELRTLSFIPSAPQEARVTESYLDALAGRFRFAERLRLPIDARSALALRKRPSRVLFHVPHPVLIMLPELQRTRTISVLVGGEYADDTIAERTSRRDWARNTSLLSLGMGLARSRRFRDLRAWLGVRARSLRHGAALPFGAALPSFVRAGIHDEYAAWLARQRSQAIAARAARPELAARIALDGAVAMNWEATSALGVRRSFPFYHRAYVELAFELHPAELRGGCNDKHILGRALRGHVPDRHLDRPKHTSEVRYETFDVDWDEKLPDDLAHVVDSAWFPRPPPRVSISSALRLQQLVTFAQGLQQARASARLERVAS